MQLDRVPLKYAGLRYDEIWISEAQERMVLAVPAEYVEELLKLSASEDVESTVIGTFGTPTRDLVLNYQGFEVGRLSMDFLHDGLPKATRKAVVPSPVSRDAQRSASATDRSERSDPASLPVSRDAERSASATFVTTTPASAATAPPRAPLRVAANPPTDHPNASTPHGFAQQLLTALSTPNIASKHWIIRQYDHEVQGGSVIKPLIGPLQIGPSDAAVVRPNLSSHRGVVISCGMNPAIADPYAMAIASIDEAIRNAVCVGGNPARMAILDNFCWPSVDDEQTMGTLVLACEACRDAALAMKIPFISGKDSLHNQFTNSETGEVIRIPRTLLISAIGILPDVRRCITMDFKTPGNAVWLIETTDPADLPALAATHHFVAALIAAGTIVATHDLSDGGLAVAAAEMCIASGLGVALDALPSAFTESPGRYLLETTTPLPTPPPSTQATRVGHVHSNPHLTAAGETIHVTALTTAWRGTLDW